MPSRTPTTDRKPSRPSPPPEAPLARIARTLKDEALFIFVPTGGWTARRALGRVVLGVLALSGPGGVVLVASLVLLKERHHIADGIRRGIQAIHSRSHRGRRIPSHPTPPRPTSPPSPEPEAEAPAAQPERAVSAVAPVLEVDTRVAMSGPATPGTAGRGRDRGWALEQTITLSDLDALGPPERPERPPRKAAPERLLG